MAKNLLSALNARPPPWPVISSQSSPACFWRYVFRARREADTSGLTVHAGDKLMLEVPTAEA